MSAKAWGGPMASTSAAAKAKAEAEKYDLDNVFAASLNADSDTPQGKPGTKVRRINQLLAFPSILL